ncbi:lymphocyte antigen 6E-like [Ambystoma mexicanum]|uniref:lymphocyte antigen 6E-like n=1 Tax=Ambystoma mexicanum TaxID=8296 RepID=UPI0037E7479D
MLPSKVRTPKVQTFGGSIIAHTLRCYTCTSQTNNSQCMTATNCTSGETNCKTDVINYAVGKSITKACASSCTVTNVGAGGIGYKTECCSTDLCNTSGATGVKISYVVLAATVGFIGLLQRGEL